jgi:uncharacterized phiE125 gp8 family phage protein
MTYEVVEVDNDTLANAMLDMARFHMRVDFYDDDDQIVGFLQAAIALFENHSGWRVSTVKIAWEPEVGPSTVRLACPLQPASAITVIDSLMVDVTSEYKLSSNVNMTSAVYFSRVDRMVIPAGLQVALTVGYDDPFKVPPMVRNLILRIASHFYEHRESVDTTGISIVPQWLNDLLLAHWIPRC